MGVLKLLTQFQPERKLTISHTLVFCNIVTGFGIKDNSKIIFRYLYH